MEKNVRNIALLLVLAWVLSFSQVMAQGDYLTGASGNNDAQGRQGTISVLRANIRYGPDTKNYKIVVTLAKGDIVTVYETKGEWYAIGFPKNGKVWLFDKYVDVLGNDGTVNANNVTLRDDARFTGLAIGEINKGARVRVLSRQGKWLRISPPSSLRAYAHKNLVQLASQEHQEEVSFRRGTIFSEGFRRWGNTPEGKNLKTLDEQLWVIKTSISFRKSKESELKKAKEAIRSLQKELNTVIRTTKDSDIKNGASVIYQKAERIIEYIDAILNLRMLLFKIEQRTKEELEALENKGPDHPYGGYIDDVGRFIGRKTRYVLKRGDEVICFLVSKKYNLKDYYYTEVAITGFKRGRSEGKTPILLVTDMQVKGRHSWNAAE